LAIIRRGGRSATIASAIVVCAVALNRLWEHLYGAHFTVDPTPLGPALRAGWTQLPQVLDEQIGAFDYLEVTMPRLAYVAWFCMVVALMTLAFFLGGRRERTSLLVTFVASILLPVLLEAAVMRHTGFGLQGRYVLPFTVAVPLLAGEIVYRHRSLLGQFNARGIFVPFAAIAAVVQIEALYTNARRFAVGLAGPTWFFGHTVWHPPGGWLPWLFCGLLGAASLVAALPVEERIRRAPR
jgi:hypothetical protein